MLNVLEYILLTILIAISLAISRWMGQQAYSWMPPQATIEAQQVDDIFSFLVSVGTFVFLGVGGVIVYSIIAFRVEKKDYREGHPMRGNWKIEILWTVVPIALVIWLAFQSYKIYDQLKILGLTQLVHLHNPLEEPAYAEENKNNNNQSKPASEEIEIIAKQWDWSFRYSNNVTSHELHLPLNQSVRLVLHSLDVIHGFYVPEFRVKQDIIPKRTITFVFIPTRAGKYKLRDSQFSGKNFALMEADVYVENYQNYLKWLNSTAYNSLLNESKITTKTLFNSGWAKKSAS